MGNPKARHCVRGLRQERGLAYEKLDGSGYPWKLGGDDLDSCARILVVADIYEALTATRPYRGGMSPEAALTIMERDRGSRLDPRVLDVLSAIMIGDKRGELGL